MRAPLGPINPATTSGTALALLLSDRGAAENSGHSGTGRPSYATAGMLYTDDSFTPPRLYMASVSGTPDVDLSVLFAPPPGTLQMTAAVRLPTGWLWADGSSVLRSAYSALFDAICPLATGSVAVSTTISTVSLPAPVEDISTLGLVGAKIEGSGIPAGATITAITPTTITLSVAGTGVFAGTSLRIIPHGTADATHFNLPNAKGRVIIPRQNMGGSDAGLITVAGAGFDGTKLGAIGGAQTMTLLAAHLPTHSHTAGSSMTFVSGAGTTVAANSGIESAHVHHYSDTTGIDTVNHNHAIPARSGSFLYSGDGPAVMLADLASNSSVNTGFRSVSHMHNFAGNTEPGNPHLHSIPALAVTLSALTMTVATTVNPTTGGDQPHKIVQPSIVENVMIKV